MCTRTNTHEQMLHMCCPSAAKYNFAMRAAHIKELCEYRPGSPVCSRSVNFSGLCLVENGETHDWAATVLEAQRVACETTHSTVKLVGCLENLRVESSSVRAGELESSACNLLQAQCIVT
jgi:hypothetical protein